MKTLLRPALSLLIAFVNNGKTIGSELIGQPFSDSRYFWSRPSATTPFADNSSASAGSNLGPNNPALVDAVRQRIDALHDADENNIAPIPVDLVTASGSGLDPHLSPAAARYQIARVARARKRTESDIAMLVEKATEGRQLGILGEPRVNVLRLNLSLDEITMSAR
jgi:potassium-transporting ATPase KdpC subunit